MECIYEEISHLADKAGYNKTEGESFYHYVMSLTPAKRHNLYELYGICTYTLQSPYFITTFGSVFEVPSKEIDDSIAVCMCLEKGLL